MLRSLLTGNSILKILITSYLTFLSGFLNGQNTEAVKYNNAIVGQQHKVVPHIVRFFETHAKHGCSLEKAMKEKERIETMLDKGILKVQAMKPYYGNDSLRQSALKWLKIYKRTFDVDFETAIPLLSKKEKTEVDKQKLRTIQEGLFEEEDKIDEEFEQAQWAFVKKYNLKMVELPLEPSR